MNTVADPWLIELIIVRASHDGRHHSALSRDVTRGLLVRLRRGVYVERLAYEAMGPVEQHIVRMRALVAVTDGPVVFSLWSAAVVHGLPVLERRLDRITTTVAERRERGQDGVSARLGRLTAAEVQRTGGLLVTALARTVVDLAAAGPFDEGVMAADAALRRGIERDVLETAHDLVGPRSGHRRAGEVLLFAHPGAESAAESRSRTTLLRIGVEPPELQHRLVLPGGREAFLDMVFRSVQVGAEVDGAVKLRDPAISADAREALVKEKRREDAVRLLLRGFARWGWAEAGSVPLLSAVLRRVGVNPAVPHATLQDYADVARAARPRKSIVVQR